MTPSQAAQEKPTSPRTPMLDALAESYAEADNVLADMDQEPAPDLWPQLVYTALVSRGFRIVSEREAAAATPSLDPEKLASLVTRSYMRGWSNGRYNNAPPNPMAAVEELIPTLARLDEGSATPDQGKGEPR